MRTRGFEPFDLPQRVGSPRGCSNDTEIMGTLHQSQPTTRTRAAPQPTLLPRGAAGASRSRRRLQAPALPVSPRTKRSFSHVTRPLVREPVRKAPPRQNAAALYFPEQENPNQVEGGREGERVGERDCRRSVVATPSRSVSSSRLSARGGGEIGRAHV